MPLDPGSRLGAHEIVGLLGAGGMGEVYRATDTRLKRDVAVKVLPEAFAGDSDRMARFQREAELLASLNHPNIAGIYGLEQADPSTGSGQAPMIAIVLELVEGETLADIIARGPIAVVDALPIAHQIAEALEAAHEKGVVHRDLKPANIKITAEGRVKVLDFGLAKMLDPAEAGGAKPSAMSMSPTLSVHATYAGVILGTAAYMSPEQARGKPVDRRTDVWAFGCVLFEMLTGKHAFEPGETVSDAIASVLTREPDLATLAADTPTPIRRLLRRCLQKDPQQRLPHIGAARLEIDEARRGSPLEERVVAGVATPTVAIGPSGRRRALQWMAAAATFAAGASIAGYAAWRLKPESARPIARFNIALPSDQTFTNTGRQFLALSPDGSNLAYTASGRLWIRPLSGLEAHALAGSDVAPTSPAFSPDGQWLAFTSAGERSVKRIAITGGSATTLSPIDVPFGLSWDDTGILVGQIGRGIVRVSANGGPAELIVSLSKDEMGAAPHMLPGGDAVLFSLKKAADTWDKGQIVVQRLSTKERKMLISGGADARYVPTGHLVYAVSGVLLAVPFNPTTLAVTGAPVPLVEGVQRGGLTSGGSGLGQYTFSTTGELAYVPGPARTAALAGDRDLAIFDRNGTSQALKLRPGSYRSPRVSRDGKFVAFDTDDGEEVVWIYDLAGGSAPRRLTFGGQNRAPVWSPDSQWIAFQSDRDGDAAVFRQRADGSGSAERLTKAEQGVAYVPQSWSADGDHLLITKQKDQRFTLVTLRLTDRTLTPFGDVQSIEPTEAAFSPDGRWVLYQSRADRTREVFVQPFPATGAKYLVPAGPNTVPNGPGHPHWTRKGTEIVINAAPTQNYAISFKATPQVVFGQPVEFPRVGRNEPNPSLSRRAADALPDGERIIGVTVAGGSQGLQMAQTITVVLNWFADLKQRMPVK
jgi:Tol biopolymer transport system component